MNLELARKQMLEQQIRAWEVLHPRVLSVLRDVPRERFVPERYRGLAFADTTIPLGHGQVMMQPNVEGRLLQALDVQPDESVLEIGTGSGFLAACLARLGASVTSVEIFPDLSERAHGVLDALGVRNVKLEVADASRLEGETRYDAIAVTGSLPTYEASFQEGLSVGGRLFAIVGQAPVMEALLVTRVGSRDWARESLFETEIPPLVNAPPPSRFQW